jgi:hypothetical protein
MRLKHHVAATSVACALYSLVLGSCAPAAWPVDVAGPAKLALDESARLLNALEDTELARVHAAAEAGMAACVDGDVPARMKCREAAVAKVKADEVARRDKIDALVASQRTMVASLSTYADCAGKQASCVSKAATDLQVATSNAMALVRAVQAFEATK